MPNQTPRDREQVERRKAIAVAALRGNLAMTGQSPTRDEVKAAEADAVNAWLAERRDQADKDATEQARRRR